jgi:hypothetical protein
MDHHNSGYWQERVQGQQQDEMDGAGGIAELYWDDVLLLFRDKAKREIQVQVFGKDIR